jgi:hypothetical protein
VSRFVSGHERLFRDIREESGLTLTLDISRHRSEATCEKETFDEDGCYSRANQFAHSCSRNQAFFRIIDVETPLTKPKVGDDLASHEAAPWRLIIHKTMK